MRVLSSSCRVAKEDNIVDERIPGKGTEMRMDGRTDRFFSANISIDHMTHLISPFISLTELNANIWRDFPNDFLRRRHETLSSTIDAPLPPVRRTLSEVVTEWQEEWLTPERLLVVIFILTFIMQSAIILTLNLIFRYEETVNSIRENLRHSWPIRNLMKLKET